MARVLVLFASTDGQTGRIADRIAARLRRDGHVGDVEHAEALDLTRVIEGYDGVIVGGGVRYGSHPKRLEETVRRNRAAIEARPTAFFSVCLSAGGPGAKPKEAAHYVEQFLERTGLQPHTVASFAGALLYTKYNFFIRLLMRFIVGHAGGE